MVKTWISAGVVLLVMPGLVGCDSGPKASDLGGVLRKDGSALLDEAATFGTVDGVRPTITDDASEDVPCGDRKVKRVYSGSFPFEERADVDTTFDLSFKLVLGALDTERYKPTQWPDADDVARRGSSSPRARTT